MRKSLFVLVVVASVMGNAVAATAAVTGLKNLADLPSASGMVLFQQQLYVVVDNSPSLYRLDPEFQRLVITASVDAGEQGAHGKGDHIKGIRGSYLATIPLTQFSSKADIDLTANAVLLSHQGQPLRSKVEAIALDPDQQEGLSGVLAADNDDGFSQLMRFKLL